MTYEDNYRETEPMTNYEIVYHYSNSSLTVQGKESLMEAPLNLALATQGSSQTVADESWMKRIWEWADEFEIPEKSIPRNRDELMAITRLAIFKYNWESPEISYLPDELTLLSNLTVLTINYSAITVLPESIGQLTNLTKLSVGNNNLKELPESIGQLINLTKLSVSNSDGSVNNNEIGVLPESIGQLINLIELDINFNNLRELPESIGRLTNLTESLS